MGSSTVLFLSIIFGAIGSAYFIYGRKQRVGKFLLSGFLLFIIPYFPIHTAFIVIIGIAVTALPFLVDF